MVLVASGSSGRGAAGMVGLARGLLGGVCCDLGMLLFALRFLKSAFDASSFGSDPYPMVSEKNDIGFGWFQLVKISTGRFDLEFRTN